MRGTDSWIVFLVLMVLGQLALAQLGGNLEVRANMETGLSGNGDGNGDADNGEGATGETDRKTRLLDRLQNLTPEQQENLRNLTPEQMMRISSHPLLAAWAGNLSEEQLERLSALRKKHMERLAQLRKDQLEKMEGLTEDQLARLGELEVRNLEKITALQKAQLARMAMLPRPLLHRLSVMGQAELDVAADLDEEEQAQLGEMDEDTAKGILGLGKEKARALLLKVRGNVKARLEMHRAREKFLEKHERYENSLQRWHVEAAVLIRMKRLLENSDLNAEVKAKLEARIFERGKVLAELRIQAMIARLEAFQESGNAPEGVQEALTRLEGVLEKVKTAETEAELETAVREAREAFAAIHARARLHVAQNMVQRLEKLVEKMDGLLARAEDVVADIKEERPEAGAKLEGALAAFQADLADVNGKIAAFKGWMDGNPDLTVNEITAEASRLARYAKHKLQRDYLFLKFLARVHGKLHAEESIDADLAETPEVLSDIDAEIAVEAELREEEDEEAEDLLEAEEEAQGETEAEAEESGVPEETAQQANEESPAGELETLEGEQETAIDTETGTNESGGNDENSETAGGGT